MAGSACTEYGRGIRIGCREQFRHKDSQVLAEQFLAIYYFTYGNPTKKEGEISKMKKRIVATVLALGLVLSMAPAAALAQENQEIGGGR